MIKNSGVQADSYSMGFPSMSFRVLAPIGAAVVLVPVILNMGFGYIDTITRIGDGEEVEPTYMLESGEQGIRPGQTSEQAEKVLGQQSVPVASTVPGERCRGYALSATHKQLVVCYATRPTGPGGEQRWVVTSSRVDSASS